MRQRGPNPLITQVATPERMEDTPIQTPADNLIRPIPRRAINLHRPRMKPAIRDPHRARLARRLVAHAPREPAAVRGAEARGQPVDGLEDVELAALRPRRAVVDAVAQHPKGRPHALLAGLAAVAEADGRLDLHDAAGRGHEGGAGLDAARGPEARGGAAGDELDGAAARDLEVGVGGCVDFYLVVGVDSRRGVKWGGGMGEVVGSTNAWAMFHWSDGDEPAAPPKLSCHIVLSPAYAGAPQAEASEGRRERMAVEERMVSDVYTGV